MRGYLSNFFFSSRLALYPGRALAAEMSPALEENGVATALSMQHVANPSCPPANWWPPCLCTKGTGASERR